MTKTAGHLKVRGRFGSLTRKTKTPTATTMKEAKVPRLVMWLKVFSGNRPEIIETAKATNITLMLGVPNFLLSLEKAAGINPSRDITKKMRD